jgi:hypothetical protein
MRWVEHVAYRGDVRNALIVTVGKPEEKRQLGRPRHRWKENVRMDHKEIGSESVGWRHLAQDRN